MSRTWNVREIAAESMIAAQVYDYDTTEYSDSSIFCLSGFVD